MSVNVDGQVGTYYTQAHVVHCSGRKELVGAFGAARPLPLAAQQAADVHSDERCSSSPHCQNAPCWGAAEDGALPACSRVGAEVAAFKRSQELVPCHEKAGRHALPSDPPLQQMTSPLILSRRGWSWPCTVGPSVINHAYAVSSSSSGPNVSEKGANLMPSLQKGNSNGGGEKGQRPPAAAAVIPASIRTACCPSTQLWLENSLPHAALPCRSLTPTVPPSSPCPARTALAALLTPCRTCSCTRPSADAAHARRPTATP